VPAAQPAPGAADGIDFVDEDDAGACAFPARTGRARASADADEHLDEIGADSEKGRPASPATALAEQVLPVPGGRQQAHLGQPPAQALELLRVLQEVDDFSSSASPHAPRNVRKVTWVSPASSFADFQSEARFPPAASAEHEDHEPKISR